MLFYHFQLICDLKLDKICRSPIDDKPIEPFRALKMQIGTLNEIFAEGIDGGRIKIFIHREGQKNFYMIASVDYFKELTVAKLTNLLRKFFAEHDEFGISVVKVKDLKEITFTDFSKIFERAKHSDRFNFDYYQINQELGFEALENRTFKLTDIISPVKRLSYSRAMKEAKGLLADETLKDEFARIYSNQNAHHFYGQPVHYKICAGNTATGVTLSNLLVSALYSNKRLISRRISIITNITENCYGEDDFDKVLENAAGGTVIIELSGEQTRDEQFASTYETVADFIAYTVNRYQRNTLFIFVELADKPGFASKLYAHLQENIHIIELSEGVGNRDSALDYLKSILETTELIMPEYTDEELLEALGDKHTFSASEILKVGEKLFNNALKDKFYPAYREVDRLKVDNEEKSNDAYTDLKEMIGLTEQKALIEQIIAAHRVQKMRLDLNLDKQKAALHMSFTGNPGSAKTTVARLFAQILARDGVLKIGQFIECGRADLVAKYVGWTAKNVKEKFREARGGVLFIDEAYSLLDGSSSTFGDEAINAIVQEMENHRDDVIVIFAGYPDKMKNFLERNEGLRSRIAFHINFPDYTPNELMEIFKLMAKRRGYEISAEVADHCQKVFTRVAKQKNFGNGRFVRTFLEQAWLRQSQRIVTEHAEGTVTKDDLTKFTVADFDINLDKSLSKERTLGFVY